MKELLGIVFGGFFGLAIGYYLLNYFGGEQFDFLKIPLPLVKHTAAHWPGATPGSTSQASSGASPAPVQEDPAAGQSKPETPGPNDSPTQPPASPDQATPPANDSPPDQAAKSPVEPPTQPETAPDAKSDSQASPAADANIDPLAEPAEQTESEAKPASETQSKAEPEPGAKPDSNTELAPGANTAAEPAEPAMTPPPIAPPPVTPQVKVEPQPAAAVSQPEPLPADYVGPRTPPQVSAEKLDATLKAVREALAATQPDESVSPDLYRDLCTLGEMVTFAKADPADAQMADRQQAVHDILTQLAKSPSRLAQIEHLAGALLASADESRSGVLLVSTAGRIATQQGLHGTVLRLEGYPETVTVLSRQPFAFASGDRVLMFGSIVRNPKQNLVGFEFKANKPFVVWSAVAAKLD